MDKRLKMRQGVVSNLHSSGATPCLSPHYTPTSCGNSIHICHRLALLIRGIIGAHSASPARIAQALQRLGLRQASAESLERSLRRIQNDPELDASLTLHPFARAHLLLGKPARLLLVIDPTTQDDRVVLLSVSVRYHGRALLTNSYQRNHAMLQVGRWPPPAHPAERR